MNGGTKSNLIALIVISTIHMLTHVYNGILFVLIPILLDEFSINILFIGLIISLPKILSFLAVIPVALISDRVGSRKMLTICLIFTGISGLIVSISQTITVLTLGIALLGISIAMYHPPAMSMVSKMYPGDNKSKAMGVHGVGGTIGSALGPITLSLVIISQGWRVVYLFWAIPLLLFSIVAFMVLPKELRTEKETDDNIPKEIETVHKSESYAFFTFLVFMFCWFLSKRFIQNFMTSYLIFSRGVVLPRATLIFGFMGLVGPLATLSGGYMGDKLGEKKWLGIGAIGCLISILGIIFSPSLSLITVMMLFYGYFSNSHMGAAPALVSSFTSKKKRALGYAMYSLPGAVAGISAPIIGSLISEVYGFTQIMFTSCIILVLGLMVLFILKHLTKSSTR